MIYVATGYWVSGYTDGDSKAAVISDLQSINPSSVIELFDLDLTEAHYFKWTAATQVNTGKYRAATTKQASGFVFEATTGGISGNTEPTWPTGLGQTVTDGGITWKVVSTESYYFHSGINQGNAPILWGGRSYQPIPMTASGFEYAGQGSLPRPSLVLSNLFSTITALILLMPDGLEGAKVTRTRTLAKYIDDANFTSPYVVDGYWLTGSSASDKYTYVTNPYGTPDSTATMPLEIFYVDRKAMENRDIIEFELASVFDLAGIRLPKRQCTSDQFPSIGTFYV